MLHKIFHGFINSIAIILNEIFIEVMNYTHECQYKTKECKAATTVGLDPQHQNWLFY